MGEMILQASPLTLFVDNQAAVVLIHLQIHLHIACCDSYDVRIFAWEEYIAWRNISYSSGILPHYSDQLNLCFQLALKCLNPLILVSCRMLPIKSTTKTLT
jgi:hypothetical protein